jgi:hypothetical protein
VEWDKIMDEYDLIYFKKARQAYEESLMGGYVGKIKREEGQLGSIESPNFKKALLT